MNPAVKQGHVVASAIAQVTTGTSFDRVASVTGPQLEAFKCGMMTQTMSRCGMFPFAPGRFGAALSTPGMHRRA